MFYSKNINNNLVYCSDLLPNIEHFFTTRGVDVITLAEYLGVTEENLVHPVQTHSSNIDFAQIGVSEYPDTDALILTNFYQAVYLRFADCTPVILYDKKANIGAVVHAGWRGTVASIVPKTIDKMIKYSASSINDFRAVIGPAIGSCCYKVGDEVINGVKSTISDFSNSIFEKKDGVYVDLKNVNAQQLFEMGMSIDNIDICPYCTSCNNDLFYSYRKEQGTQNRHYALIKLRNVC